MKRLFILVIFFATVQVAFAQRADSFRFQMDLGAAAPGGGGIGALVNLEPQILVKDNLALGMRFAAVGMAKDVTYYEIPDDYDGELGANFSFSATANYYFNRENSRVAPYVGAGFGYYVLSNLDVDSRDSDWEQLDELKASFAWAPMVRAGVEVGKFRAGLEYNFVPNSDLQNFDGDIVGEATNRYFGFTLGYFIGGGRWGRKGWN
ncbi:MAG: hypothetical protein EP311_02045 [Cytophagales bacterium]|uniref:Outer membrane protein beta-barrel domain-containing protein n=1 Tax=Algoriphagus taiwanensis TaxID=1445656 RepID=A0ABQ6PW20_9BACT|nr:MAG: hypothetical protein EP311_02045 [Cytophagales bacterium]GMQ32158.1 hypothetical protein Ataiwa_04300 [Algoriphagus taiwanensis]